MAQEHKILGQQAPANTNSTVLYTVPGSTDTIVSTLTVSNLTSGEVAFDVAAIPSGDSLSNKHYIYFNIACPGRDTFTSTLGFTLGAGDKIEVKDRTGSSLAFGLFGVEIA